MYIFPRMFGIGVYLLLLMISLGLLERKDGSKTKGILVGYLLALAVVAFLYYPDMNADLYRIRNYVHEQAANSWQHLLQVFVTRSSNLSSAPAGMIYYKLLGALHVDGLIPCISFLIVYGLIFYMMFDYKQRHQIENRSFILVFFVIMSMDFFLPTISTIRSYIATVLIVFCIYIEVEKGKFGVLNVLFYIVASLMHNIGIVLVAIRLVEAVIRVFQKKMDTSKKKLLLVVGILLLVCSPLYSGIIMVAYKKILSYLKYDIYSYSWEWVLCILQMILLGVILFVSYQKKLLCNKLAGYKYLVPLSYAALLVSNIQFTFVSRLTFFTELLMVPLAMQVVDRERKDGRTLFVRIIFGLAFVTLLLTCARGYLCSLKFWE